MISKHLKQEYFKSSHNCAFVEQYIFIAGAKVNQASKNGEFPLAEATINGNLKTVECLLKAGADVNMQTTAYNGAVTLMLAVRHKHRKITELLVKVCSPVAYWVSLL